MSDRRETSEDGDDKEDFQNHFPAIYREITEGEGEIQEAEIKTEAGSKKIRKFTGYTPSVIDFICRCSNEEEAVEIIEYMLKKGDISQEKTTKRKRFRFFWRT